MPLAEFIMHTVFTRMPGGVAVGDSGLGCCFPCLLSAVNSLYLLNLEMVKKKEKKI